MFTCVGLDDSCSKDANSRGLNQPLDSTLSFSCSVFSYVE